MTSTAQTCPKAPVSLLANRLYLSLLALFYTISNRLFLVYHLRMINFFFSTFQGFSLGKDLWKLN